MILHGCGGHVWLWGACMVGGVCMVAGGMHSCGQNMCGCRGACMVAEGVRAWDTMRYGQ